MPTIGTFDGLENNLDVYRGEDYMKRFCESIRDRLMKIINSERKKIVPLTNDQHELYEKTKICYMYKKRSNINH